MNSLPCDPNRPWEREVTVVFGKDRPEAREKARQLGAEFLPDTREESHRVMVFLMRNILPTNTEELAELEGEVKDKDKKLSEAIAKLEKVAEEIDEDLGEEKSLIMERIEKLAEELKYFQEKRWMFHGKYKPIGEVYSLHEFLNIEKDDEFFIKPLVEKAE